jgi:quinoprotein dehydrogenase-associated probable ABC transporter substrate-binding protein
MSRGGRALLITVLTLAVAAFAGLPAGADEAGNELRICADPNNLPFSNDRNGGFENAIAQLFAKETGQSVAYTWWAQRRGFIRNTLKAGNCDVIMGVPVGLDMVETTRPYYRSSYVFVSRSDRQLDIASMTDPRLKTLKIGIQLIGDNGFNTPPGHALAEQGIVDNVVGYTVYGDYRRPDPPAQILEAVARGEIDIAAVWGPLAGYFARQSPVKLRLVPITDTERFAPLRFQFDIAIGVRKGDDERRDEFDQLISRNSLQIADILDRFGVPVVEAVK